MKKSDIFKRILAVVSNICKCTPQQICSPAKPQRLVDARSIAVHFLHAAGFTFNEISDYSYECNCMRRWEEMQIQIHSITLCPI